MYFCWKHTGKRIPSGSIGFYLDRPSRFQIAFLCKITFFMKKISFYEFIHFFVSKLLVQRLVVPSFVHRPSSALQFWGIKRLNTMILHNFEDSENSKTHLAKNPVRFFLSSALAFTVGKMNFWQSGNCFFQKNHDISALIDASALIGPGILSPRWEIIYFVWGSWKRSEAVWSEDCLLNSRDKL